MNWYHITALGGLGVCAPLAVAIAAWLAVAHCRRRALYWCALFGLAMAIVIVSKLAFIGWGIGSHAWHFTGFSGHAARAGAIFPVAAYLLCREARLGWRIAGVGLGALLALLVALSRLKVFAHSPSEAVLGVLLGLATAGAFILLARSMQRFTPNPYLIGLTVLVLVAQPRTEHVDSQQWLTGIALKLSGHDRPYNRYTFLPNATPYQPPCAAPRRRFDYFCY